MERPCWLHSRDCTAQAWGCGGHLSLFCKPAPCLLKQHFNFPLFSLYGWSQQEWLLDISFLVVARRKVFGFNLYMLPDDLPILCKKLADQFLGPFEKIQT